MATQVPKPSAKRQRLAANAAAREDDELASMGKLNANVSSVLVQFQSSQDDSALGSTLSLPASAGQAEMSKIVNELKRQLSKSKKEQEEDEDDDDGEIPYTFHVLLAPSKDSSSEPTRINITNSLHESVLQSATAKRLGVSLEDSLTVVFEPQAVFRVRAVSRCSSTLSGHASPILCCAFSPTGQLLATGAGDKTCRIWDMDTETPLHTLTGHTGWVLCAEWEPRERKLATGSMDGQIYIWDALDTHNTGRKAWGARSGKQIDEERAERGETGRMSVAERRAARHASPPGHLLRGHTKWITSLSWEPVHRNARAPRLASSSKDGTVRIWNVERRQVDFVLGGHTASVNMVRWGGEGAIYTASSDRTVRVWNDQDGRLIRTLNDHAHWVNTLAISTDYLLRTGPFDVQGQYLLAMTQRYQKAINQGDSASLKSLDEIEDRECRHAALSRYNEATANGAKPELVVSGSDDQTLFLWPAQIGRSTESPKKPLARLTGHQKTVNHVCFSPDSRLIASASFDNSVKLWDGRTGKFIANLRGHVASVYRLAWSSDSRMLATASKDSTIKLWNLNTFKIKQDLPGHEDEVYCVDFIADKLASGGRDRTVKIWRH